MTFVLGFLGMLLCLAAMAVGWILKGKALSGSCGGVDPDGKPLADCLCEKLNKPLCEARLEKVGKAE